MLTSCTIPSEYDFDVTITVNLVTGPGTWMWLRSSTSKCLNPFLWRRSPGVKSGVLLRRVIGQGPIRERVTYLHVSFWRHGLSGLHSSYTAQFGRQRDPIFHLTSLVESRNQLQLTYLLYTSLAVTDLEAGYSALTHRWSPARRPTSSGSRTA